METYPNIISSISNNDMDLRYDVISYYDDYILDPSSPSQQHGMDTSAITYTQQINGHERHGHETANNTQHTNTNNTSVNGHVESHIGGHHVSQQVPTHVNVSHGNMIHPHYDISVHDTYGVNRGMLPTPEGHDGIIVGDYSLMTNDAFNLDGSEFTEDGFFLKSSGSNVLNTSSPTYADYAHYLSPHSSPTLLPDEQYSLSSDIAPASLNHTVQPTAIHQGPQKNNARSISTARSNYRYNLAKDNNGSTDRPAALAGRGTKRTSQDGHDGKRRRVGLNVVGQTDMQIDRQINMRDNSQMQELEMHQGREQDRNPGSQVQQYLPLSSTIQIPSVAAVSSQSAQNTSPQFRAIASSRSVSSSSSSSPIASTPTSVRSQDSSLIHSDQMPTLNLGDNLVSSFDLSQLVGPRIADGPSVSNVGEKVDPITPATIMKLRSGRAESGNNEGNGSAGVVSPKGISDGKNKGNKQKNGTNAGSGNNNSVTTTTSSNQANATRSPVQSSNQQAIQPAQSSSPTQKQSQVYVQQPALVVHASSANTTSINGQPVIVIPSGIISPALAPSVAMSPTSNMSGINVSNLGNVHVIRGSPVALGPKSPQSMKTVSPNLKPKVSGVSDKIAEQLAQTSNYQAILEGTAQSLGISYPSDLQLSLESRRTTHKAAEQKRRDSLKQSFDELKKVVPYTSSLGNGAKADPGNGKGDGSSKNVSKLFLLKKAHDYIVELHSKVIDKDETIRQLREELAAIKKPKSSVNVVSQESNSEKEIEVHRANDEDTVMEVDQESNASEGHDESDG
ncbi:4890_t:CDS:2 [Paraglomus occultum]|uniref:4890_t:CDS:1 n=1 Tax=Paraglomus occultum TaxID=144539 RepID=A0A9N8VS64_9GLOM|nr:4890_t:CDS:2 [Paraglomus occultum]